MIEDSSSQPLYYQVTMSLRDQIANGELRPGDRLPSEAALMDCYGVSRVTIRKALQELVDLGLTEHRGRRGHFVKNLSSVDAGAGNRSLFEITAAAGKIPSSKIVSMRAIEASGSLAKACGVETGTSFIEIRRLRLADDSPFALETLTLPRDVFDGMNPWEMEKRSLLEIMRQDYGIEIDYSTQSLRPQYPTKEEAAALLLDVSKPLLSVTSNTYDRAGRMVKRSESLMDTDIMEYSFTLEGQYV